MMSSATYIAPYPVTLPHHVWSAVWCHLVRSPYTVVVSCEWSTGLTLHCSHLSERLGCLDSVVRPHVLQAILAQA
jgi:hypothetical protein